MFFKYGFLYIVISCVCYGISVSAYPSVLEKRTVTPLPLARLTAIRPLTRFAAAAYCSNSSLSTWTCGTPCQANKDFQLTKVDGDGDIIQRYIVGFSPSQNSVIVSHQGTDPLAFNAIATDLQFPLVSLNPVLFPGVPQAAKVHMGFSNQHSLTAVPVLNKVKETMKAKNSRNVTLVGHSLGGALAVLDALYLTLNLPPNTIITTFTYGAPRVGNSAFAQYLDTKAPGLIRINNMKDFIPILPPASGTSAGYQHAGQEFHIVSTSRTVICPGRDNSVDPECTNLSVPNPLSGNIFDHLGPYDGVYMGGTLGICLQ